MSITNMSVCRHRRQHCEAVVLGLVLGLMLHALTHSLECDLHHLSEVCLALKQILHHKLNLPPPRAAIDPARQLKTPAI